MGDVEYMFLTIILIKIFKIFFIYIIIINIVYELFFLYFLLSIICKIRLTFFQMNSNKYLYFFIKS